MHPGFLSLFPHRRLIRLAVLTWLGMTVVAYAIPEPEIVIEGTLALK